MRCSILFALYPSVGSYFYCCTYQGVTLDEGGRFSGEAEKKLEEVIQLHP